MTQEAIPTTPLSQAIPSRDTTVPMVDLTPLHQQLRESIDNAIAAVLQRGDFVNGEALRLFEERAANYLGVEHAIGVGSGTDALTLALRAAGIGKGDEVITTPFSYWATAEAIASVGARAVYVDITDADMNMDPEALPAVITERTRAILPVHIFGQSAAMDAVMKLARWHGLVVIEDAAQAFGATYGGKAVGSLGLAGCFSFYPSKPLGCFGDGGLVTTNDSAFANRLRALGNHGTVSSNRHTQFGGNSRLDSLQAAVLNVKLQYLDTHLEERRRLAERYARMLTEVNVQLPTALPDRGHCFAQFTIRCDDRDGLQSYLAAAGIGSAIHYPMPLYRQAAYGNDYAELELPVVETCARRCLSLPLYQGLPQQSQSYICERIAEFFAQ